MGICNSAQPNISATNPQNYEVPLSPLPEQRKIAAILTSVDEAIEATQAVIDQLQVVKKAMMAELLTRGIPGRHTKFKTTEIGEVPEGWEVQAIGALVDVIDPQPDHRTPPTEIDGVPYIGMADIDDFGHIALDSARKVSRTVLDAQVAAFDIHQHAFVFGKIGTICNPTKLNTRVRVALSANLIVITSPDSRLARYVYYVVQSDCVTTQILNQTNTTSQPALGIKKVRAFSIPLPSIAEQERIVERHRLP